MKLRVIVHPNSKKPRIKNDMFDTMHIYVSEPPVEGRANEAAVRTLSELYKIPKSDIRLISGHTSKSKIFEIVL